MCLLVNSVGIYSSFLLSVFLIYLVRLCFFTWVVCLCGCGCFALRFVWVVAYFVWLLDCDY